MGESSVHGLPRSTKDENPMWLKVFWAAIFLGGFGAFIYFFQAQINTYLSYPSTTSTSYSYAPNVGFPAVTVCNLNPVKQSALLAAKLFWNDPTQPLSDAEIQAFSYSLNELITVAQFSGLGFNKTSNFFQYTAGAYGNCFAFNYPTNNFQVRQSGPGTGLYLEMNINQDDYLFGVDGAQAGALVYIHDQLSPPTPSSGITVAPGVYNSISVQQLSISRLSSPYGNCDINFTPSPGHATNVAWCFEECLLMNSLAMCGCKPLAYSGYHPTYIGKPVCPAGSKCIADLEYRLNNPNLNPSCNCPPPCTETRYSVLPTSAQWPSVTAIKTKLKEAGQSVNDSSIDAYRQNYLAIEIFFSDLNLESITQAVQLDAPTFLANVGGLLGLWVGGSVLSAAEIIPLCIAGFAIVFGFASSKRFEKDAKKTEEDA